MSIPLVGKLPIPSKNTAPTGGASFSRSQPGVPLRNSLLRQPQSDLFQPIRFGLEKPLSGIQTLNPYRNLAEPGLIAYDPEGHRWYYTGDPDTPVPDESRRVGNAIVSHMLGTLQAEKANYDTSRQEKTVRLPHPCHLGRQSIKDSQFRFAVYPAFDTPKALLSFLYDLHQFSQWDSLNMANPNDEYLPFMPFIACFKGPKLGSPEAYAALYHQQLAKLCALDRNPYPWRESQIEKARTGDEDFLPSLSGRQWDILLFYPDHSRASRDVFKNLSDDSPWVILIVNEQLQSDTLRNTPSEKHGNGLFDAAVRIRRADRHYQQEHRGEGTINPNLVPLQPSEGRRPDDKVTAGLPTLPDGLDYSAGNEPPRLEMLDPEETWKELTGESFGRRAGRLSDRVQGWLDRVQALGYHV